MTQATNKIAGWALSAVGALIALSGFFLLCGGIYLMTLGGSLFFAPAGLGLLVAGALIARRRLLGAGVYLAVFAITVVWSLFDAGLAFWPLFSRLLFLVVMAGCCCCCCPSSATAAVRAGPATWRPPR